jgi:hypothetical protein
MKLIKKCGHTLILSSLHATVLTAEASNKGVPATTPSSQTTSIPTKISSTLPATTHHQNTGESFSLMLSDDEQKMISSAMSKNKNATEDALTCHYLGGIVYSTPTNWTIWLNDQAHSNGSEIPGITILEVTNNRVNLKASDSKSKNGSWLEMGKTFCCDTGQTLAGDQRR